MWVSTSSGRIELNIKKQDALDCAHSGACDDDVMWLSQQKYIQKQTDRIDPVILADELKEYGAWDAEELSNHEQNIQRILWLMSRDIAEGVR